MLTVFLKKLAFPFSLLYGIILYIRNKLYDWTIFKVSHFSFPVISVGNLSLGGVGKTPHIEYLIRLFQNDYKVATLSRGYKRHTKGFMLANDNSTVSLIGDEPLQYHLKFDNINVAVDEKRVNGIKKLKQLLPDTNLILLDDAYQHRSIKPGINILITEYRNMYINDTVIPSGRLREWKTGSKRADIIIVSKTPKDLCLAEKDSIKNELRPLSHQKIYFSFIKYGQLTPFSENAKKNDANINKSFSVLLVTGIAKPTPFFNTLSMQYNFVEHLAFPDHHNFTDSDISIIKNAFDALEGNNKLIISTEKDIMRLSLPEKIEQLQQVPIFYIPIEICFHGDDKKEFDQQLINYVKEN